MSYIENIDEIKRRQLQDAMALADKGIDPDILMVTFDPEDYAEAYMPDLDEPGYVPYELTKETVDSFPINLIGSKYPLRTASLSVDAISSPWHDSYVELYLDAVSKALQKEGSKVTNDALLAELGILSIIQKAIEAALEYHKADYASDEIAYEEARNHIAKSELAQDLRNTRFIISGIEKLKEKNEQLSNQIRETLGEVIGGR